jgi:tRNA uridine 5-carboxymethylaminomethyl modification enzyme
MVLLFTLAGVPVLNRNSLRPFFTKHADMRLTEIGWKVGLVGDERYQAFCRKKEMIAQEIARVKKTTVPPSKEVNDLLISYNSTPISSGFKLEDLIKRPELDYFKLEPIDPGRQQLPYAVQEQVSIAIKYEGYIVKQLMQAEQFKKLENRKIPENIDYGKVEGIRIEARDILSKVRPVSLGQASRISGVNPADIAVLQIYLEQTRRRPKEEKSEQDD